ncbi:MAG: TonB-dependent receptor plug domain-containing protein [Bradyrhizobium sp.]
MDTAAPLGSLKLQRLLRGSVAPLGLLALLASVAVSPGFAQTVAQAERKPDNLGPVVVTPPKTKPAAARSTGQRTSTPARTAGRSRTRTATPAIVPTANPNAPTPLNGNTVTDVASRLGLTVRETPASVDVVTKQTIEERGLRTTTDIAQSAVGVTGGDSPGAPASFSMRGFTGTQINTLYNGIKVGPSSMTGRIMDTANLDRVEILKGPASLLSGEGAVGGAVNYVTKTPHTGPVVNEAFTSFDSFKGYRAGYGSGGSTLIDGLDYRFDLSHSNDKGFIDDTYSKLTNASGQLNYRVSDTFKVWGAYEYKQDKDRFYWGTPLVPANSPGIVPTNGIVSGLWTQYWPGPTMGPDSFLGHVGPLNPVTIDARTLRTNYNVLDNDSGAKELWLRSGFQWDISSNVSLKSQVYAYDAHRHWFNNEINSFNDSPTPSVGAQGEVYRERLALDHAQRLYGNVTDLTVNSNIAGMDNRLVTTVAASSLQFNVAQDTVGPNGDNADSVSLLNPDRGLYGARADEHIYTHLDNVSLSFEDRLKVTSQFALIGGIRFEDIELSRTRFDETGVLKAGYPFATGFHPVTGRAGYTWEAVPGVTFYSQYATAADPAVANIFILRPTQPRLLTTARTYETGVKLLSADKKMEFTVSAFDIERKNVYVPESGQLFNIAGKIQSKGFEIAGAVNPIGGLRLWGNAAIVRSRFVNFDYVDDNGNPVSYSGMTPANVPSFVANAGASYRFDTAWPLELGGSVRHVGDRFNFQDNLVTMNQYTLFDAYAFVDVPKTIFNGVDKTRIIFRVKNITNKLYAQWGDSSYPDQVILGAPRSYEIAASFKW